MHWCKEYRMWVDEIAEKNEGDCPFKIFHGCENCQNLKIIKDGGKKK
jgi:hypothetical protein